MPKVSDQSHACFPLEVQLNAFQMQHGKLKNNDLTFSFLCSFLGPFKSHSKQKLDTEMHWLGGLQLLKESSDHGYPVPKLAGWSCSRVSGKMCFVKMGDVGEG